MKDRYTDRHPSYGMIALRRTQGDVRFFASSLPSYGSYMSIEVYEGRVERDREMPTEDLYMPDKPILRLRMSAAQFATMLTTVNMGAGGVPCTLERVREGEMVGVPPPPAEEHVHERSRKVVGKNIREAVTYLKEAVIETRERFKEKRPLNKEERKNLVAKFQAVHSELTNHLPFMLELFEEAMDKVVVSAKAEMDAFVTMMVHQTGLDALKSGYTPALKGRDDASG